MSACKHERDTQEVQVGGGAAKGGLVSIVTARELWRLSEATMRTVLAIILLYSVFYANVFGVLVSAVFRPVWLIAARVWVR